MVPVAGSNVNVKQATEDVASVSDWDDEYDDEECSAWLKFGKPKLEEYLIICLLCFSCCSFLSNSSLLSLIENVGNMDSENYVFKF